jgi:hypothetical protein
MTCITLDELGATPTQALYYFWSDRNSTSGTTLHFSNENLVVLGGVHGRSLGSDFKLLVDTQNVVHGGPIDLVAYSANGPASDDAWQILTNIGDFTYYPTPTWKNGTPGTTVDYTLTPASSSYCYLNGISGLWVDSTARAEILSSGGSWHLRIATGSTQGAPSAMTQCIPKHQFN